MASSHVDHGSTSAGYHARVTDDLLQEPGRMLTPIRGYQSMPLVSLQQAVEPLVSILPAVREMVWIVLQQRTGPFHGLSRDESAAIMLYTLDWDPPGRPFYRVLNDALGSEDRQRLKPWFLYLKLFLTALDRLPSCTTGHFYRGVKRDLRADYPTNHEFVWWRFSSCTATLEVLQSEAFLGNVGSRTMFMIACHSAKDIRRHSFYPNENERLLLAGTRFRVVSCLQQPHGLYMIQLEEIPSPFPALESVLPSPSQPVILTAPVVTAWSLPSNSTAAQAPAVWSPPLNILQSNPRAKELIAACRQSRITLFNRQITDSDIILIIQEGLIKQQCTQIDLMGNKITAMGAALIASALPHALKLSDLGLSSNPIGDQGAIAIAKALGGSKPLRLDLSNAEIGDAGAQAFLENLGAATRLGELDLHGNPIGSSLRRALKMAPNQHKHLKKVSIYYNEEPYDSD